MCTGLPEALQKGWQGEVAGLAGCMIWWMFQSGQELLLG